VLVDVLVLEVVEEELEVVVELVDPLPVPDPMLVVMGPLSM